MHAYIRKSLRKTNQTVILLPLCSKNNPVHYNVWILHSNFAIYSYLGAKYLEPKLEYRTHESSEYAKNI